ncbi:hypothetical protein QSE00_10495 [Arenibacter sp. M-2]|uniref:hypothetical protein n=1 Tax=unclassified Arenibacter TaxID=2615047 RepID=UPI000D762095|nr:MULTISPECIES: hypothetical protein [unclassified Arenibacter]MDL5512245.1 hypothetical protein [Arenibacter sp. M-2]PXX29989.1 hypothetical protein C7972_103359 [Arenibacter sp. ARW7G5Y1]
MKEVLVFKTSINHNREIQILKPDLNRLVTKKGYWNFDLEDCDNILRVETHMVKANSITNLLNNHGFFCEELC